MPRCRGECEGRWRRGANGLLDKSSRPGRSPRQIDPGVALVIVELRRKVMLQAQIASYMGVSKATVSRILRRAGLSRLTDLRPPEPVQRYERDEPGELLHIDIKKLGRIERPGHRVTGTREGRVQGAGREFLYVAVDDRTQGKRRQLPRCCRDVLRLAWRARAAPDHRQRAGVPLQGLLQEVPRAGDQPEVHPNLRAADQRQG